MSENKYYDIGVNLFSSQFHEPETVLEEAAAEGILCILTGSDIKEDRLVNEFIKTHDAYGTAGIHPHGADAANDNLMTEIENIIRNNKKIVAVGECGLDYNRMFSTVDNQISCLKAHIKLAEKLGMPMFLHERDASNDMIQIFKEHENLCSKSVIHCFTGDRKTVENYLEMGFYIGITGWICDDGRADALRNAVASIPPDRILLETDAPYLVPKNVKGLGRVNHPKNIKYVSKTLAEYMEIEESELIKHAAENTCRLFNI